MKFTVFVVSLVVLATLCASQDLDRKRPCNYAFRCSYVEEPVWTTTDNRTCKIFRNGCLLASENCNRQNNYQPEAIVIEKEKCQRLCKTSCPCYVKRSPICGSYNDVKRNFGSLCEMENFICASGQTYTLYSKGLCPLKAKPIDIPDSS